MHQKPEYDESKVNSKEMPFLEPFGSTTPNTSSKVRP